MTLDNNYSTSSYNQESNESIHNSTRDHSNKTEITNNSTEKMIATLNSIILSYRDFQSKIEENKKSIKNLQSEIKISKEKKESLTIKLSKMPTPDSFNEDNGKPSELPEEKNKDTHKQSKYQCYGIPTNKSTEITTSDQAVEDASDSKKELKENTCNTIENYIKSIKDSIDYNSNYSEAYLQPLNISCDLLASQIKHTKLLERLVAIFDEQAKFKTKEKEMHDIIGLLEEQFVN